MTDDIDRLLQLLRLKKIVRSGTAQIERVPF
jgi:hypothetical protein